MLSNTKSDIIKQQPIAVIGSGSWGTALAIVMAKNGCDVRLWGPETAFQQQLLSERTNQNYLPDIVFPSRLIPYVNLSDCLSGVRDILIVVPSYVFRAVCQQLRDYLTPESRIAWATKGFDPETCSLLHEIVAEELGADRPAAVLSGPTFAKEVAQGLPSAITLAGQDEAFNQDLLARFHQNNFRVYVSHDISGVEIGGALKNVVAIAAGIADGLGFGANARCALITRGLAEIMRLAMALGAQPQTLMGLSGLGDLILTCTDNQSRNRRFGLAIGKGESIETAKKNIGQVIEGLDNAAQAFTLSKKHKVEMPIVEQIYRVLYENVSPRDAVNALMNRPTVFETGFYP